MNCNRSCCCWINPNWVDDSFYQYKGENAAQYLALKDKINNPDGESFEQLRGRLKDFTFFPKPMDEVIERIRMEAMPSADNADYTIGLLYLTKFEEEEEISPFTADQAKIIQISSQTDEADSCWLHAGGSISIILGAVGGCVPPFFSAIPAFFSQAAGCLATGKYPDLSSIAANTRQNIYHDQIQPMYQNLGLQLIELKEKNFKLAKDIALHLKIDKIRDYILEKVWVSGSDSLIMPLLEAKEFILYGTIPCKVQALKQAVEIQSLKSDVKMLKDALLRRGDFEIEKLNL